MCKADMQGGCEAECERPEGALFCDGQYIDHGGNLDECVAALQALLDIEVEGYAEGSCSNGSCSGSAGGMISCAVDPDGGRRDLGWLGLVLGAGALLGARRRFA
jgi:MYXO-CTERM domain-containing protein